MRTTSLEFVYSSLEVQQVFCYIGSYDLASEMFVPRIGETVTFAGYKGSAVVTNIVHDIDLRGSKHMIQVFIDKMLERY